MEPSQCGVERTVALVSRGAPRVLSHKFDRVSGNILLPNVHVPSCASGEGIEISIDIDNVWKASLWDESLEVGRHWNSLRHVILG